MKINIPETLKADLPSAKWGKILGATPVIMTVVATLLAGLASSEMTRAQYDRSLAAQLQSKAGDQWNFFQGKKLRSALQHNTLDLLASTAGVRALDTSELQHALAGTPAAVDLASSEGQTALTELAAGRAPEIAPAPAMSAALRTALTAFAASRPESELSPLVEKVNPAELATALRAAEDRALAFDAAAKPVSRITDLVELQLAQPGIDPALQRSFTAARLRFNAGRYDGEAQLNQAVADLYELQVRQSNYSAARHHRRSQQFFYGMLAAQMGVIISTLAMAARKHSLLWSLAAAAGLVAIAFAAYVYLFV